MYDNDDYNDSYYFVKKCRKRGLVFIILTLIMGALLLFLIINNSTKGVYNSEDTWKLIGLVVGMVAYYILSIVVGIWLCSKSKIVTIIALVLTLPFGLFIFYPLLNYHNDVTQSDIDERNEDRKVFKLTVRAYQKAWARQHYKERYIYPILLVAGVIVAFVGFFHLMIAFPTVMGWIILGALVLLVMVLVALMGGISTFTRRIDYYDVSVGEGFFDYGEVYLNHTDTKYKDETKVSILAVILAIFLIPFVVIGGFILLLLFLVIEVISIIIPPGSAKTIYLKNRNHGIHPDYVPLGNTPIIGKLVMLFNRLIGKVFSKNLVNKDYWLDGRGPQYIYENLSDRNLDYLYDLLDKIDEKYGYHYNF